MLSNSGSSGSIVDELKSLRQRVEDLERKEHLTGKYSAIGMANSLFMNIPQLLGYWTMGFLDEDSNILDLTPRQKHLLVDGSIGHYTWGVVSYLLMNSTDALVRYDKDFLIGGNKTFGGWFYPAGNSGAGGMLLNMSEQSNYITYRAQWDSGNVFSFRMGNSAASAVCTVQSAAMDANKWHFWVARHETSGGAADEVKLFVDGTWYSLGATWGNSYTGWTDEYVRPLTIGARYYSWGNIDNYQAGDFGPMFFSYAAVNEVIIENIYQITKGFFE